MTELNNKELLNWVCQAVRVCWWRKRIGNLSLDWYKKAAGGAYAQLVNILDKEDKNV